MLRAKVHFHRTAAQGSKDSAQVCLQANADVVGTDCSGEIVEPVSLRRDRPLKPGERPSIRDLSELPLAILVLRKEMR